MHATVGNLIRSGTPRQPMADRVLISDQDLGHLGPRTCSPSSRMFLLFGVTVAEHVLDHTRQDQDASRNPQQSGKQLRTLCLRS